MARHFKFYFVLKENVTLMNNDFIPHINFQAIGEPPLFLSSSVFFAVKEAILSARADTGHDGNFPLNSPATPERVRMACEDQFTDMVSSPFETECS